MVAAVESSCDSLDNPSRHPPFAHHATQPPADGETEVTPKDCGNAACGEAGVDVRTGGEPVECAVQAAHHGTNLFNVGLGSQEPAYYTLRSSDTGCTSCVRLTPNDTYPNHARHPLSCTLPLEPQGAPERNGGSGRGRGDHSADCETASRGQPVCG